MIVGTLEDGRKELVAVHDGERESKLSWTEVLRHRHRQTKGCGSRMATLAMVFKLGLEAEKRWRRIDGYRLILKLLAGVSFEDGIEAEAA